MNLWEAFILGIVQGATEFLPVSSSGHLVVAQELLNVHIDGVLFEVAVHVATLLSIMLVYRERIRDLVAGMVRREGESWSYVGLLVVATLPAAILGLTFEDRLEALFDDPIVPGVAFLVTGLVLWSSRSALARNPNAQPVLRAAILIGLAQAFALIPGISRSGSTVVAALWLGIAPAEAAAFSFLMALPAIGGAAVLQVPDVLAGPPDISTAALVAGGIAAAVTGVLAIRTFVEMLKKRSFYHFATYVWLLGAAYLTWVILR